MTKSFQPYQENIESIQEEIKKIQAKLRPLEQSMGDRPGDTPIKLIRERKQLYEQLSELREKQARLVQTSASASYSNQTIVPYLLNRLEHETKLSEALKNLNQEANKLLVCLIHGDKQQSQDTFPERLKHYFSQTFSQIQFNFIIYISLKN
ncbi:hypothetical protein [Crocosphaera sp. Alani8]|uniref:hypothetical protein n=1 Tax=Crocosphaera sp. Alani8 TaxID=3038952 RepID=UPI00313CD0EA